MGALAVVRRPGRRLADAERRRRRAPRSSRTSTGSSCRTSARTPGRRRDACDCCARRARSSSRSSSSTTATPSSCRTASPISRSTANGSGDWPRCPTISEQLLIADGHHRYETALAFNGEDGSDASGWMMVVLVSTREEGLTIFPTHRIAARIGNVEGLGDRAAGRRAAGRRALPRRRQVRADRRRRPRRRDRRPARARRRDVHASREEAEAAVDRGDAEGAFLLRARGDRGRVRVRAARRGAAAEDDVLLPEADSGLLFYPLD